MDEPEKWILARLEMSHDKVRWEEEGNEREEIIIYSDTQVSSW